MPKTRFLIISDTHNRPLNSSTSTKPFRSPLPRADVLLHCGDLTMRGDLSEYRSTLQMLASIDAELKLVIAGNHDRTLDKEFWEKQRRPREDEGDHERAVEMWKGKEAEEAGVTYLEEGLYEFVLKSGAKFSLYASPYQPEFCNWAFPYPHDHDRFNPTELADPEATSITVTPIPSFPDVDIVMTHGPPHTHLDKTLRGDQVGCPHLLRAITRARPRIHCFGHIHEGWGAEVMKWGVNKDEWGMMVEKVVVNERKAAEARAAYVDLGTQTFGESTLMVNAAVLTGDTYAAEQAPWVVDVELPVV